MIAPTHIAFSEFIYLLILTTAGVVLSPLNAIAIGVASLLPDIDTEASRIGRLVPFVSRRLEKRFGHRTLTHSLLCIILVALVLSPILFLNLNLNLDLYICLIVGYASHPFLDTMTINGVRLFYPFSELKCVFPLEVNQPHRYRVQSGSKVDKTLAIIFLIGCFPTYLIAHHGYERFVRFTQRSVESAVRDYNEFSKTHSVVAELVGHDLLTKEQIAGTFEVVGALDEHTLLFKDSSGHLHSIGQQYSARYVGEHALCMRGKAVMTSIRTIDLAHQTLGMLVDSSSPGTLYFGSLRSKDKFTLPPEERDFIPIKGSANHMELNFASIDDIRRLGLENIVIEQGELIARTLIPIADPFTASFHQNEYPRFTEVSVTTNPDQNARVEVNEGDTVAKGQPLAVIVLSTPLQAQVEHNRKKIFMLALQLDEKLSDLWEKVYRKELVVHKDSVEYTSRLESYRNHFTTTADLDKARRAFDQSSRELKRLIESEVTLKNAYLLKTDKAATDNVRLLAKLRPVGYADSVIRSTVTGVITNIHRTPDGRNQRTTFVIRCSTASHDARAQHD